MALCPFLGKSFHRTHRIIYNIHINHDSGSFGYSEVFYMIINFSISKFNLSYERQDIYRLDIVDGHRLVFQWFDSEVLGLVFLNSAVLALHGKDDGACAWVFGCKVLGVVDDGG